MGSIIAGSLAAPSAWVTGRLIDDLGRQETPQAVIVAEAMLASVLLTAVGTLSYLIGMAANVAGARVQLRTSTLLTNACATPIGTEPFDRPAMQDELRLAQMGAHDVPMVAVNSLGQATSAVVSVVSFATVLVTVWPPMIAVVFATVLPATVAQHLVTRHSLSVQMRAVESYRWSEYFQRLFAAPESARDMRVNNAHELLQNRMTHRLATALRTETRHRNQIATVQAAANLGGGLLVAVAIGYVAVKASEQTLSIGSFVLFTAACAAIRNSVSTLLNLHASLAPSLVNFERFERVVGELERASSRRSNTEAPRLQAEVEFRNVSFRYAEAEVDAVNDINLRLERGQRYALVGPNGAGKTTLIRLLLRLYEPTRGEILWDGTNINTFDIETYRNRVTAMLQDFVHYELAAVDNIGIGYPPKIDDRAAVQDAIEASGSAEVIASLPSGLKTMLTTQRADGDRSVHRISPSRGEWQRIGLARMMMRTHPDVVVLDEPSSGLDPRAEAEMQRRLRLHAPRAIHVQISHRLGGLQESDQIFVLRRGKLIEAGTHADLISQAGEYADLYAVQSEPYRSPDSKARNGF